MNFRKVQKNLAKFGKVRQSSAKFGLAWPVRMDKPVCLEGGSRKTLDSLDSAYRLDPLLASPTPSRSTAERNQNPIGFV